MSQTDLSSPFFPLPDGVSIISIGAEASCVVIHIACSLPLASCPGCGHPSERRHGTYVRTVADLPCAGRRVLLKLSVRKFVCGTPSCSCQIFTERFPDLVRSYARMTNRLSEALEALGFATCGEVGERLAPKLGISVSGPTLLRRMRMRSYTPPAMVHMVGIDDWAWKKGRTYGTILVDLEARKPIEVLADRSRETVEAWLRQHPEVEVVSRDRAGEYATAARNGAPQAQQVADRFHLLKNLREGLNDLMARKQSCLPEIARRTSDAIPAKARGLKDLSASLSPTQGEASLPAPPPPTTFPSPRLRPPGMRYKEYEKSIRRENRYARYEAVRVLHQQGFSNRHIARRLKLARDTVAKYVGADVFPEIAQRLKKGRLLDPYKPYLLERWQQGCWNGTQLTREVQERGYTGSPVSIRYFLAEVHRQHQHAGTPAVLTLDATGTEVCLPSDLPPKTCVSRRMSPTQASWLFVSRPEKLDEQQRTYVEHIRQSHPDLELAYQLAQGFVSMLAERRATDLDPWLTQTEHSGLREFKTLAKGIRRDYAAVKAACSSEWSNGQVEAHVNCLKLQKRMVFGRANFDLLRLRVLHRV